ncbi:MAG: histidine phosphatase family protein [Desulfitobacteriaceae bacterium]|nr:histidine phosphatase family protein [Desulfitobacteriaceae bacterium]MDD4347123.1 histidine phosphatase family protein [Desulfitobacteriaceae bacterium]MDD4402952.1 histidine phosphatase family protein [Desulfitobacteriaceae bacterium]
MTRIILTRHGETEWNIERRVQGRLDSPLTKKGLTQARSLALRLRNESIQYLYSSDSPRALATAEEIRREIQLGRVISEPRIREFSFGDWEGKLWDELRQNYRDIFRIWDSTPQLVQVPSGDNMYCFSEKVWEYFRELITKHRGETICLVSHGLTLKLLVTKALGFTVDEWLKTPMQFNTAVNILEVKGTKINPVILGDCSHLETTGL